MSDYEFETTIEHKEFGNGAIIDWPVMIVYDVQSPEPDVGISHESLDVVGVYNNHSELESETNYIGVLAQSQLAECHTLAIDDYTDKCETAQAMAEDAADMQAQERRDIAREFQLEHLAGMDNQRGYR